MSPVITLSLGTWQTSGVLPVTVTNTYPRTDGFLESINLYIDVMDNDHRVYNHTTGSGVPNYVNVNTSCLPGGAHTILALGGNCEKWGTASAGFAIPDTAPSVDASFGSGFNAAGNGTLTVNYNFPNTGDYRQREIIVERNGVRIGYSEPNYVSGTVSFPQSTNCFGSGTYTYVVRARTCGDASHESVVTIPIAIDATPQLTLNASNPDSNGNVTIGGGVYFPNTLGGGFATGDVYTYVNNEPSYRWHDNYYEQSSSLTNHTLNVACTGPYTIRAVAVACSGATTTQQASGGTPGMTKPMLTLKITGTEPITLIAHIHATVKYAFPVPSSGWSMHVDVVSWLGADGTVHPGYGLGGVNPALQSGTWTMDFLAPSGARQIVVTATMSSCLGDGTDTVARELPLCCQSSPSGTKNPVAFADGDVRYSDSDPLPRLLDSIGLGRTYDSQEGMSHLFGRGWMTFLDQRLMAVSTPTPLVYFTTADNGVVVFTQTGSTYVQSWPKAASAAGTLRLDSASSAYEYRPPSGTTISRFRASDGRFIGYRQIASGRAVDVVWDSTGLPVTASDSWTGVVWQFHTDAATHRITSIDIGGRPDLLWTYNYDASGALLSVLAPGSAPWRTYEYGTWGMTAAYDPLGSLIESHTYDGAGFGASSKGPDDEITSIQYGLAAPNADDTITRVITSAGATIDYTLRASGGAYRTVHVGGGCAACGTRNAVYVLDDNGRISRQQSADGYVTQTTYAGSNVSSTTTSLKPAGCDPQTAASHCRLTEDTLVTTSLETTAATMTSTFTYADALWPERPTRIDTTSVLNPSGTRSETVTYDAVTGEVLLRAVTGWTGPATQPVAETHTTTTFIYASNEVATFNPGGAFTSAWLSLPQPANLRKSIDGPRTDVSDVTAFVYYPIDTSVPPLLRGRLAAVRNAASHLVRYEDYDVFGNPQRVIDPNGVITESTFDALGRPLTTTIKGTTGCSTTADPLCATDLVTTRTYSPAIGPLASQTDANGNVRSYSYDARSRVISVSRGPSASSMQERIEYTYDAVTALKTMERYLAMENGSWVETHRESFSYDTLSQLTTQTHPDNTAVAYTYDDDGRVLTVRDENHTTPNTSYGYDAARRLASVQQTLGGGQAVTAYGYDVAGNLTRVTDPNGNVTTYLYDDFGRMLSQTSPVTGTTAYNYDLAGNLISTTDANGASTMRIYDAAGRVTSSTSTRGGMTPEVVTWMYDDSAANAYGIGRVASMLDPAGSTAYRYERRGMLASEQKNIGAATYTTAFRYDAGGNRSTIVYPSGNTVSYSFDFAGRPLTATSGLTPLVSSTEYLPFGPMTRTLYGNGTTRTVTSDSRYRPVENKLTGPAGTLADYTYAEDAVGNITQIHDALQPVYDRNFGYDDLNRLITANSGSALWGTGTFAYDAMGNMLSKTLGSNSAAFSFAGSTSKLANIVENGVSRAVSYDAAGNEGAIGGATYQYGARNTLASVHGVAYGYDGRGVRTVTTTSDDPAQTITLNISTVPGGNDVTGTVTVATVAPASGITVTLSSSHPAVASVPASVTLAAGESAATFTIHTTPVSATESVNIAATYIGTVQSSLIVSATLVDSLVVTPSELIGGSPATGSVQLTGDAPAGGITVGLASNAAEVSVPASVTIAAGTHSGTFTITTTAPASTLTATITAAAGSSSRSASLMVHRLAPDLLSILLTPSSTVGGFSVLGMVTLTTAATSGGALIPLSSSNAVGYLPASVTVPQGASSATFPMTTNPLATPTSTVISGVYGVTRSASLSVGTCGFTPVVAALPALPSDEQIWMEDAVPPGAAPAAGFLWDSTQKTSGTQSHLLPAASGTHYDDFAGASTPMVLTAADKIVVYALIDPCNPPREILLDFYDETTSREHRAYWGENLIPWGTSGTAALMPMGGIPNAGEWVKLTIPAAAVGLSGHSVGGMAFAAYDGKVWFDRVAKTSCIDPTPPSAPASDSIWFDDDVPTGGITDGTVTWDSTVKMSGTRAIGIPSAAGYHEAYFWGATSSRVPAANDKFVFYVMLSSCSAPRELMLQFRDSTNNWEHRAFWGENLIARGTLDTASRRPMGGLPEMDRWVRLEVSAALVGAVGRTIDGVGISLYDGEMWVDRVATTTCLLVTPSTPPADSSETLWFDDATPAGASLIGSAWTWNTTYKASGTQSHTHTSASSDTYHGFVGATATLTLGSDDVLVAWGLVDPCNPPRELLIQFLDSSGSWEHRAFWGEDLIALGTSGRTSRFPAGRIPLGEQWVRLEIPAKSLGLAGLTLKGIAFDTYEGRVWFDRIGKRARSGTNVAVGRTATTSGSYTGSTPGKANDGNVDPWWANGSVAIAALAPQAWWQVDLGAQRDVTEIILYNRTDVGTMDRLANYDVFVSEQPITSADPAVIAQQHGVTTYHVAGPSYGAETIPTQAHGRYVRVQMRGTQWLQLAEVEVYATGQTGALARPAVMQCAGALEPCLMPAIAPVFKAKTDAMSLHRYSLYTPELNLLAETATTAAATPAMAYEYVWFGGQPLAQIEPSTNTIHYYFNDHLGTPILTTSSTATVDWRVEREPFGAITTTRTPRYQPLAFPGQEDDGGTERTYNVFRWYRAGWGRYTQSDPLEWAGQEYAYASDNPIGNTDTLGLFDTGSAAKDAIKRAINACGEKSESAWGGPVVGAILLLLQADDANPEEFENRIKKCNKCDTRRCRPCIPPVGTRAYREDTKPTSPPHRGISPPHWHLYEMQQSPPDRGCVCFWHPIPDNRGGFGASPPPAGAVPITPAAGGGIW